MFLRMFLEGYMEYAITSLMNVYKVRQLIKIIIFQLKWDSRSEIFSSVFSLVIFVWIFLLPILLCFLLKKNFSKLSDQKIIDTFGSTYYDLRQDSKIALMYNVFYMLRRLFFSFLIFVLKSYPYLQIQLLSIHCIPLIMYTFLCNPFNNSTITRLEIFNELSILLSSYHLFAFTPLVDSPSVQYHLGWSLIGVITLNIAVNMLVVIYSTYCSLKIGLRRLLFRYR